MNRFYALGLSTYLTIAAFAQTATAQTPSPASTIEAEIERMIVPYGGCPNAADRIDPRQYDWMQPLPFGLPPTQWTDVEARIVNERYVRCVFASGASMPAGSPPANRAEVQATLTAFMSGVLADLHLPVVERLKNRGRGEQELDAEINRLGALKEAGRVSKAEDEALYQALLKKKKFAQVRANYATQYLRAGERYDATQRSRAEMAAIDRRLAPYEQRRKAESDFLVAFKTLEASKYKLDWCSSDTVGFIERGNYERLSSAVRRLEGDLLEKYPNPQIIRDIIGDAERAANVERRGFGELVAKSPGTNSILHGDARSVIAQDFPQLGVDCRIAETTLSSVFPPN